MSLRLPEPGSFEDLLHPIRIEVASLVRLSRHPATEPILVRWRLSLRRSRVPSPAGAFGTCYTASTIEVAFAESVIHESGRFADGTYEVPAIELTARSVVRFICERRKTLVLADLTGAALKSLGPEQ
ncbi:MAG TPA: RES domain-containing protein [Burkholderiaceae bacterium]